jgi:hypothetical protein
MGKMLRPHPTPRELPNLDLENADWSSLLEEEEPLRISRELLLLAARGELTLRVGIGPDEPFLGAEDREETD